MKSTYLANKTAPAKQWNIRFHQRLDFMMIRFCEFYYPELINHLSSCKSPHQMLGAVLKSYYAEKIGVDPKNMYVVSIMPCVAKKSECARPEMEVNGIRDVDTVLTTRELGKMIKQARINFLKMPDEEFDPMFVSPRVPVLSSVLLVVDNLWYQLSKNLRLILRQNVLRHFMKKII